MSRPEQIPTEPEPGGTRDERIAAGLAWIAEHWQANLHCECCDHDVWAVGDVIDMSLRYEQSVVYSFFPVTCMRCGNTHFINANVAGIADLQREGQAESEDGEE